MKNISQHIRRIAVHAVAALVTTFPAQTNAATKPAETLFANPVLAKGKGFEVKQNELVDAFIDYKSNVASQGGSIPENRRSTVESNLLQRLIVTKVLMNRADDADKTKAKESSDTVVANAKKQAGSDELFVQQLKATGMSPEEFRTRIHEQALAEAVVERELKSKIKVTDEEAKKYYDENAERFERPETVRAAHILISTVDKATQQPLPPAVKKEKEKLAKDLKARAEKADFAKLAQEFSEDPGSKDKGGEYTFARGEMVPEFETAAFSLKTNQVSDVVETRFGYHIIKTLQKIEPEKIAFDKVLPDLREGLIIQEMQKQMPEYFEKIKKEANVEIVGGENEKPAASTTDEPKTK